MGLFYRWPKFYAAPIYTVPNNAQKIIIHYPLWPLQNDTKGLNKIVQV